MIRVLFVSVTSSLLFFMFPLNALSEVLVHDMVVPEGEKMMLAVEIKGRFFGRGGKIVEILIDEKSIGSALSGGDGFAFKQFVPVRSGIYKVTARSGTDEARGLLLSLRRGTGIVVVDIEGSLLDRPFSKKFRSGSQKAIRGINRRFPVVLLHSGPVSLKAIKGLLKDNGFMELPVISWSQGAVFDEIHEKGFKLKAVIGSPQTIEPARRYHPAVYTFEEAEDAIEARNWDEIGKRLK